MIKRLSLLAALLLVIGVVGVLFTFNNEKREPKLLEEKTIQSNGFNQIMVATDNGDITILPTNENRAHITLYGKEASSAFTTKVEKDILHIEAKTTQKKLFSFDFYPQHLELTVYLPQEMYEKIYATSDNGKITMQALSGTDIQLRSINGRITVDQLQGDHLLLQTNNGLIEAEGVESNMMEVNTDNGRINLKEIAAEIIAETDNGKISLHTAHLDHSVTMHSDNGRIDITTDNKPNNIIYDLQTQNGNISVFGKKNWDTIVGNGDHVLKVSTANGNITIK